MADEQQDAGASQAQSKEEQIGIHKGALSTLANERKELVRLVQICDQLIEMHVKNLKELGVDLEAQAQEAQKAQQAQQQGQQQGGSKNIDELL